MALFWRNMYPYHNLIRKRIQDGELIGVIPSEEEKFAVILIFSTEPHTRPIRPHAIFRYRDVLAKFGFSHLIK